MNDKCPICQKPFGKHTLDDLVHCKATKMLYEKLKQQSRYDDEYRKELIEFLQKD